jgi:hypothetical protein
MQNICIRFYEVTFKTLQLTHIRTLQQKITAHKLTSFTVITAHNYGAIHNGKCLMMTVSI